MDEDKSSSTWSCMEAGQLKGETAAAGAAEAGQSSSGDGSTDISREYTEGNWRERPIARPLAESRAEGQRRKHSEEQTAQW